MKAEIEAEEKATAQEEKTAQQIKDKEWASRVIEAQSNIQKRNRRHINAQKQSRISPQRQALLENLGSSRHKRLPTGSQTKTLRSSTGLATLSGHRFN